MAGTIRTQMIGPDMTDDRGRRCHRAIMAIANGSTMAAEDLGLSQGELLSVLAAAAASVADELGLRDELAGIFENWAVLLRKAEQPIVVRAQGSA